MPLTLISTYWGRLGYPILDDPVYFPYDSLITDSEFRPILSNYNDGPGYLNKGDLLTLELSTEFRNIEGEWFSAGVTGPDGAYLRPTTEFVRSQSWGDIDQYPVFSSIEEVDFCFSLRAAEMGLPRQVASDELVIMFFKVILDSMGKKINNSGTRIIEKEEQEEREEEDERFFDSLEYSQYMFYIKGFKELQYLMKIAATLRESRLSSQ